MGTWCGVNFRTALISLLVVTFVLLALVWTFQRRLIYFPAALNPATVPSSVEAVSYTTEDGLTLDAWYLAATGEPYGTVIVFNGNAGNRAGRQPLGEALRAAGFSVLLTDYRGYGGNPGRPTEEGLAADARAALAYVRGRLGTRPEAIFYFGESLGAAVAIGLAHDDPPAALVLRSPFTSLTDIAATHYPLLPASVLLRDRYPNVDLIRGIDVPLMVVAGTLDQIVPIDQSRQVLEAAAGSARLLEVADADHNDAELAAGDRMIAEVAGFLVENARRK